MARIPGFHPGGPGSIPGVGEHFFFFFHNIWKSPNKSHLNFRAKNNMSSVCIAYLTFFFQAENSQNYFSLFFEINHISLVMRFFK